MIVDNSNERAWIGNRWWSFQMIEQACAAYQGSCVAYYSDEDPFSLVSNENVHVLLRLRNNAE